MVKFQARQRLQIEFAEWCNNTIPPCDMNVNTFITFLSMHRLIDDEIINIWCENREREEE